jgi:outer membrane receptor protein involved in Fe transport
MLPKDMNSALLVPLPGYIVFDLRGGYMLANQMMLTLAVENLTDEHYRRAVVCEANC